jgi:hypothetical protein
MELQANTGQADASSIFGSGLLNTVSGLGNTAANILTAVKTKGKSSTVQPTAPQAAQSPMPVWAKWAIVGGVVLLIGLVLAATFKK